jgi:hypothetical protein
MRQKTLQVSTGWKSKKKKVWKWESIKAYLLRMRPVRDTYRR